MEQRAQNAQLLPFFYYVNIKLTKKTFFTPVLYKVNGAMFEKSDFFSPENGPNECSPISS